MNEIESSSLEDRLRAAFAAEPDVAERLARRALAAPAARRAPWLPLAALLAAVAVVAWLARPAAAPPSPAPLALAESVRIVNHGRVVSTIEPRRLSLTADPSSPASPPPRRLLVLQGGDS